MSNIEVSRSKPNYSNHLTYNILKHLTRSVMRANDKFSGGAVSARWNDGLARGIFIHKFETFNLFWQLFVCGFVSPFYFF